MANVENSQTPNRLIEAQEKKTTGREEIVNPDPHGPWCGVGCGSPTTSVSVARWRKASRYRGQCTSSGTKLLSNQTMRQKNLTGRVPGTRPIQLKTRWDPFLRRGERSWSLVMGRGEGELSPHPSNGDEAGGVKRM